VIARVVVMPKPVVNDPQGVTVKHGLNSLGFAEVADVRVGKHIEVTLDAASKVEAQARVEEMCRKLLANGVIEDYRFEIADEGPPSGASRHLPQQVAEDSLAPTNPDHAATL
jgi:phosphoribosylformylglycinamidine synthase